MQTFAKIYTEFRVMGRYYESSANIQILSRNLSKLCLTSYRYDMVKGTICQTGETIEY